jgi:RNA polymerase sigma-70 factor (ECF subfamily)
LKTTKAQPLLNEPLLLKQVAEGGWDAYTVLFNHYLPKLSSYIYPFVYRSSQDIEEVIQEVFLKIWEKRETLVAVKCFESYLFRMAKNKLIDLLKYNQSMQKKHQAYSHLKPVAHSETEQSLLYIEYYDIAKRAISHLSPKLQRVFLMSTEDELSLDEISTQLSLPKETIKKRLYLACSFIRNYLRTHAEWLGLLMYFACNLKK